MATEFGFSVIDPPVMNALDICRDVKKTCCSKESLEKFGSDWSKKLDSLGNYIWTLASAPAGIASIIDDIDEKKAGCGSADAKPETKKSRMLKSEINRISRTLKRPLSNQRRLLVKPPVKGDTKGKPAYVDAFEWEFLVWANYYRQNPYELRKAIIERKKWFTNPKEPKTYTIAKGEPGAGQKVKTVGGVQS